jgi:ABC-2 type transport system permease protein
LEQLRRDPRTIALILAVPCVLELLLQQLFGRHSAVFQEIGTPLLGLFSFITMFLVTSITMLRERTSGTLERLMTMPLHKVDILAGYGVAGSSALRPPGPNGWSSSSRWRTPCSAARSGSS